MRDELDVLRGCNSSIMARAISTRLAPFEDGMVAFVATPSAASAMFLYEGLKNYPVHETIIQRSTAVGKTTYIPPSIDHAGWSNLSGVEEVVELTCRSQKVYEESLWFDPCEDSWERYVISIANSLNLSTERIREEVKALLNTGPYMLHNYAKVCQGHDDTYLKMPVEKSHYRTLEYKHKKKRF